MTTTSNYPGSEHLAWVQWWAFPWRHAHDDWKDRNFLRIHTLNHVDSTALGNLWGVTTCLPLVPDPTVLRLALASTQQLHLALTLIHDTLNAQAASPSSDSHQLWCIRLSKALPPNMMLPGADPLQLLLGWVEPTTWQRLRLRFARERVLKVEKTNCLLPNTKVRLNTLWQAAVWRVTSMTSDSSPLVWTDKEICNVMPTYD